MADKQAVWYSIVRYMPDDLAGELVNVGLILHNCGAEKAYKYFFLKEDAMKIKAIVYNKVGLMEYKSFKDSLEYYLEHFSENLTGSVGNITITSAYNDKLLDNLYKYYKNRKLSLTEPAFALTKDVGKLYNQLLETYIGKQYLSVNTKSITTKKIIHRVFEEKGLLNVKVQPDIVLRPIADFEDLQLKVDFKFKNGVDNYLQAVPKIETNSDSVEWCTKIKLIFDSIKEEDQIYILHNKNEYQNPLVHSFIDYLIESKKGSKILNIDDKQEVDLLCEHIQKDAKDINIA